MEALLTLQHCCAFEWSYKFALFVVWSWNKNDENKNVNFYTHVHIEICNKKFKRKQGYILKLPANLILHLFSKICKCKLLSVVFDTSRKYEITIRVGLLNNKPWLHYSNITSYVCIFTDEWMLNFIDNKITAIPGKRIHLHLKFETVSSLILSCSLNDFTQSPNMNLFSETFFSFLILKLVAGEQLYLVTSIKDPSKR